MDALYEMVDAAGGLEYSRATLCRVVVIAQEEFKKVCTPPYPPRWSDANTPAVYYEFCNSVAWTRTVDDRFKDQLRRALQHDRPLLKEVQTIRSKSAGSQFEDIRLLAKCALHKFTPPYANAGARIEGETLIYPIPDRITDPENFRANLHFNSGRHVTSVIDECWAAVSCFIEKLLDVFYPSSDHGKT